MKSESSRARVASGKSASRLVIQKGLMFAKEQIPPGLNVRHLSWRGRGRVEFDGRGARLTNRHDRQIAFLHVVTISARPFIHGAIGSRKRHLRLKRGLSLHCLRGLLLHKLILLVEQIHFLEAAIELEHNEHQRDNADDRGNSSRIEREGGHISILIAL